MLGTSVRSTRAKLRLEDLQDLILKILEGTEDALSLKKRFVLLFQQGYAEGLQLSKAYFALIAHLLALEPLPVAPQQFPNGTALLDTTGCFGSQQIPEPTQLAQLGILWMILGICLKDEVLQRAGLKVAVWHLHLMDTQGKPHLSLWSCAQSFCPSTLSTWSYVLFTLAYRLSGQSGFYQLAENFRERPWEFPLKLLSLIPDHLPHGLQQHFRPFAEEITVGMIKFTNPEISLMAHLSGMNSGLFSLHKKEVAIVNAGPQIGPYDDLSQFGINRSWGVKERPFQDMIWEKTAYHCHLKGWTQQAKNPLWLQLDVKSQAGQTTLDVMFQEKNIDSNLSMVLFIQCPKLILEGKHFLEPRCLECYDGKAVMLELQGPQEKIILHPDPALTMQVIPLAGGDHFWGADFLVAFPISPELKSFSITIK